MILAVAIQQASLANPPPASAIAAATDWISSMLFGSLATMIAVIAVAWLGFAMLSGRLDIKRGLPVIFGCFLLFGAKAVANGLRSAAVGASEQPIASAPPPTFTAAKANRGNANAFDPYAGAAVLRSGGEN
jgi:type IV secretory pathway VirB2 component (pilin)